MAVPFLLDHAGLRAVGVGPVFLNSWMCAPTVEQLARLREAQRAFVKMRAMDGGKHWVLSLVDPRVGKVMDQPARQMSNEIGQEMRPYALGMGYVVLGTGFFAAMARSVITGVQVIGRYDFPWKVVSSVEEGVDWCVAEGDRARQPVSRTELLEAAQACLA